MLDVFTKVVLAGACLFTFAWVILAQRRTIKLLSDAKMMDALITPCLGGHIYWTIPIDWKRNSGPNGLDHRLVTIQQKFDMSASGTLRVSKFGFWAERAIDGSTSRSEGVLP